MSFSTISTKSRLVASLLLMGAALAACKKDEPAAAADGAATQAATETAAPAAAAPAPDTQAMSADQLREAATKALTENRIYAPGGDNAVEYYLALRDKSPGDATATSALTDLLPYTVIAAEQSIAREDFAEGQRLTALIERVNPQAPSLPRLKQTVAKAQAAAQQRTADATAKAEEQAKLEEERRKQQAEQQRQAAQALAQQQQQQQRAAATEPAPRPAAPAQQPATPPPAATPPPQPAAPAQPTLRVLSAPPPRYPADALRSGTSGEVMVEITVGTDGSVTNARVVRANPPRVFDREALSAVRRWRFAPISEPVTTRRTIRFSPGE